MTAGEQNRVELRPNGGWDERVIVARYSTLVDVFVVVTERYVVLVDTLLNPAAAAQLLDLARVHLVAGRQLLVVNTHADWDHAWGNQIFDGPDAAHPAPIIATRACRDRLQSPEEAAKLRRMCAAEPERFGAVRLAPPTVAFDGSLVIDGDDLTLELFPTPGHTADHLAVYLPEIGTLLAGDAAEDPFPLVGTADGLAELRRSLRSMAARNPRHALYCHASVTSGPALLQRNIAHFDDLERRCRAAITRGVSANLPDDADVEALVGYPFADAVASAGEMSPDWTDLYRDNHRVALRAMLELCGRSG